MNNVDELTRQKATILMQVNVFNKWHNEY